MYQVRVSKPGHQFTIIDIDCRNCAKKMVNRWKQLGYTAKVEEQKDGATYEWHAQS